MRVAVIICTSCLLAWVLLHELKSVQTRHFCVFLPLPLADAIYSSPVIHDTACVIGFTRALLCMIVFRGGDTVVIIIYCKGNDARDVGGKTVGAFLDGYKINITLLASSVAWIELQPCFQA